MKQIKKYFLKGESPTLNHIVLEVDRDFILENNYESYFNTENSLYVRR